MQKLVLATALLAASATAQWAMSNYGPYCTTINYTYGSGYYCIMDEEGQNSGLAVDKIVKRVKNLEAIRTFDEDAEQTYYGGPYCTKLTTGYYCMMEEEAVEYSLESQQSLYADEHNATQSMFSPQDEAKMFDKLVKEHGDVQPKRLPKGKFHKKVKRVE